MASIDDAIWTLKLTIEKADRLEGRRFTQYLLTGGGVGIRGQQQPGAFVIDYEGPDEEAIDAFLFTFRFFVQNNERTSFANLEKLFQELPLERHRIDAAVGTRRAINDRLDQLTNFVVGDERLKRRRVFEVFLWGGLAHANREKKVVYDDWASRGALPMLQAEFVATLVDLLRAIFWFRQACREALAILGETGK